MIEIYPEGKPSGGLNQTSPHSGESNLFIATGVQVIYGLGDPGDVTPDARPARRHQHEYADPPARQVLLVADVLVRGDEGVETLLSRLAARAQTFDGAFEDGLDLLPADAGEPGQEVFDRGPALKVL